MRKGKINIRCPMGHALDVREIWKDEDGENIWTVFFDLRGGQSLTFTPRDDTVIEIRKQTEALIIS